MKPLYIASTKLALALLAAIFAVEVYQAFSQPVGTSEAYLYDRFVRPTTPQVLAQQLLDRDVLYALLEKRSVGLFHVSPASVRLPSLLFGVLYLTSIYKFARHFLNSGRKFLLALTLAALLPLEWDCFARADGIGAAVALQASALWLGFSGGSKRLNLAGLCLGLSVAARLEFAVPAAILCLCIPLIRKSWTEWTNRVLIPAVVAAFLFLVLPLSHAAAGSTRPRDLPAASAERTQLALATIRAATTGTNPIRIAASPSIQPLVNFYRSRYRLTQWERASPEFRAGRFDYYLLAGTDRQLVEERHLLVLDQDAGVTLAQAPRAPI